jgi:urease accessory protein UreE
MAGEKIDKKYLAGLKFSTSKEQEKDENGKKRIVHIPVVRAMTPDDVLDWKEVGSEIVIVAKDGKKYRVPKLEEKK